VWDLTDPATMRVSLCWCCSVCITLERVESHTTRTRQGHQSPHHASTAYQNTNIRLVSGPQCEQIARIGASSQPRCVLLAIIYHEHRPGCQPAYKWTLCTKPWIHLYTSERTRWYQFWHPEGWTCTGLRTVISPSACRPPCNQHDLVGGCPMLRWSVSVILMVTHRAEPSLSLDLATDAGSQARGSIFTGIIDRAMLTFIRSQGRVVGRLPVLELAHFNNGRGMTWTFEIPPP
jgi:hypothetical protein